jgi:K+-sensing histidine kinase KdpD
MAIKNIALLMEREVVLNISGITLFCSLFLGGMITSEFLVAYSSRIRNLYLLRENEKKMALLREENIRNRGAVELQQLVHDLKRPLTTITGLTDVILSLEDPSEMKSHTSVIRKAARNMNGMVSEMLSGRSRRNVKVSELIDYTCNQISPFEWKEQVRVDAEEEALKTEIQVNLIRLSRALVNLLDNSRRAVETSGEPRINIEVVRDNDMISVLIRDNGPGFGHGVPSGNYSGWNSTGIGLGFVEQVVEDNGGTVIISDDAEGGGVVEIRLPVQM